MDITKTTQNNNVVHGHQAGRDIINNYVFDASQPTTMGCLIQRFKKERESDVKFQDTLDILKRYTNPPPGESVDGLETKLKNSGRSGLLGFAKRAKEVFAKKLMEHQFSEAAQEIHTFLLAEVFTRFHSLVMPAIQQKKSVEEVNMIVQAAIIDPVHGLLGDNPLQLHAEEINGMLYFLTGNCHIKWVP